MGIDSAVAAIKSLGLAGLIVEDLEYQRVAGKLVEHLEHDAQKSGMVDLVLNDSNGTRGYFSATVGLSNLLRRYSLGEKAVWLGSLPKDLSNGLRPLSKVSVIAESFPEGEFFLSQIPISQRGVVGVSGAQAGVVARQADLVIYNGGVVSLDVFQPFHTVLALKPLPSDALRLIGDYIAPEEVEKYRLSALLEGLGHVVPAEAFSV